MSPHALICYCGELVPTKPCPRCKTERQAKHNATPVRRAHRSTTHRTVTRIVYARDPHECRYCGSADDLTIDYVTPLSQGGKMHSANAVIACRSCNSKRGGALAHADDGR